jgi:hypothetical protein
MPGTAQIFSLLPLSNVRKLFPEKPRTVTMDAEIIVGLTANSNLEVLPAILYHFVPYQSTTNVETGMYFVQGRLLSIDASIPVGADHELKDYQFAIDAEIVHPMAGQLKIALLQPLVTICSVVSDSFPVR